MHHVLATVKFHLSYNGLHEANAHVHQLILKPMAMDDLLQTDQGVNNCCQILYIFISNL